MVLNGVAHASIVEFAKSHELDSMFQRLSRISFKSSTKCDDTFLDSIR
jgi:hypothetical protein